MEVGSRGWARPYQADLARYFLAGGKHAVEIWHRKAGKDRIGTWIESALSQKRPGLYWHALPKYEDARKVIWDAITPDGKRLIDVNFPKEIVRKKLDHEMKLELHNGSIWQPVGSDNYNSLVGAFPVHVTWSEYAIMNPAARNYIRPALAMADGSELIITTPRGFNHAHDLYQYAKSRVVEGTSYTPESVKGRWHASLLTVEDTKVVNQEILDEEKRSMPEELFRQEYFCDFSAANVGAVLGRYIESAEKEGRVCEFDFDPEFPVEVSSDIGFYDTAAWWFWQPRVGGFDLVDYDEARQLDASDWIPRLQARARDRGYTLGHIWLPFDAKAKTFQSKHSSVEQFLESFGPQKVSIVPQVKVDHRINAARTVARKCRFHAEHCKAGLKSLRAWSFEYDEETNQMSRLPVHDWSSHGGDSFSYGAEVMSQRTIVEKKDENEWIKGLTVGQPSVTLNEMWEWAKQNRREERI